LRRGRLGILVEQGEFPLIGILARLALLESVPLSGQSNVVEGFSGGLEGNGEFLGLLPGTSPAKNQNGRLAARDIVQDTG
jgi:hypothetical protein